MINSGPNTKSNSSYLHHSKIYRYEIMWEKCCSKCSRTLAQQCLQSGMYITSAKWDEMAVQKQGT